MNNDQWLAWAADTLKVANISSARLDGLILLEDELQRDRAWILAHPEYQILAGSLKKLNKKLARREGHEPLAYIRGFTEFYGRNFLINKDVLEPRPESETMIELLKELVDSKQLTVNNQTVVADIGTGSGALAITAKLELPKAEVIATDIDPKCLVVARKNSKKLNADIKFLQGDLLQPLSTLDFKLSTILLANLPYVPDNWKINQAAAMEPRIAIFGGPDGLDLYRQMFEQIKKLPRRPKYIFTESLPPQHKKLTTIAKNTGYKLQKSQDFIQTFILK